MQILLQDKYNIGVFMVNIEFMWLGQYTNIVYILKPDNMFEYLNSMTCYSCCVSMSRFSIV